MVIGIGAEVGVVEDGVGDGQAGVRVFLFAGLAAKPQEALGGDGGGGGVDWFVIVIGVGGLVVVVRKFCEAGGAGVPVRHSAGGGVGDVEIASGAGGSFHEGQGIDAMGSEEFQ